MQDNHILENALRIQYTASSYSTFERLATRHKSKRNINKYASFRHYVICI